MRTKPSRRNFNKWFIITSFSTALFGTAFTPGLAQTVTENDTMASHDDDIAVNPQRDSVAIQGYDPVAYFTELEAKKGSEEISLEWLGDTWLFSNEENKNLFAGDTMRYMPNYGGYCSYDPVSAGHGHAIDPTAWRIVNDKLYLFYSEMTAGQKMESDEWQQVKAGLAQSQ